MEKMLNEGRGFYEPDLQIEYKKYTKPRTITGYTLSKKNYYQILFVISGTFKVVANGNTAFVESGGIVISDPNNYFKFCRTTTFAESLTIYIHGSLLSDGNKENVLRAFNNLPVGTCLYPINFSNRVCFELLKSFTQSLLERRSRFYMVAKVKAIVAEIDCAYDEMNEIEKHDKNNITVNVVEYVNNNYTENLTLEFLKNKFFISYSTINRMFKQISGKTFKKYLNDLRLTSAHNMMIEDGNIMNVAKIAEMNGFKTYSTFYRDYLEKFGTPPSKMAHKKQESIWPMT